MLENNIYLSSPSLPLLEHDAVGVTIVLLTCSYKGQEFVRVGYFINNEYTDPELKENPPARPQFEKMTRNILASKPRVTRFKINWDDANGAGPNVGMPIEDEQLKTEQEIEMMDDGGGIMPEQSRMNENSNSLAMDC